MISQKKFQQDAMNLYIYIYIWRAFAYLESERKGSIFLSLTVEQRKIAVFLGPFYLGTAAMRQLRRSNALL